MHQFHGVAVPFFWFVVYIIQVAIAIVLPALQKSRGRAICCWLFVLIHVVGLPLYIQRDYPEWEWPSWQTSVAWQVAEKVMVAVGLIIAIRKPRKRDLPVA